MPISCTSKTDRLAIYPSLVITLAWILIAAAPEPCLANDFDEDAGGDQSQRVLEPEHVGDSPLITKSHSTDSTSPDFLFSSQSRAYFAPIIGASWASLSRAFEGERIDSANGNLFTAGAALGITIPAERGQIRIEIEPRYRDSYTLLKKTEIGASSFRTGDNWSVLANAWVDFGITNRLGVYAGGGLGGGGYTIDMAAATYGAEAVFGAQNKVAAFAWQAGGGAIYALNDHVHFDVGYRFYGNANGNVPVEVYADGLSPFTGRMTTSFMASELLFSLRIHEPLRSWPRR
jgi:opacity protein-like surface antigen